MLDMSDAKILVTGAGSGIGAAIANMLSEAGAAVAVNDLREEAAEAVVEKICSRGDRAVATPGDVFEDAEKIVGKAVEELDGLTGLVNNAAFIASQQFLADADLTLWKKGMDVNFEGAFLCSRFAYPAMKKQGGAIVNIATGGVYTPFPGSGAYAPSKSALLGLTKLCAVEWGPDGIRANAVLPGVITGTGLVFDRYNSESFSSKLPLRRNGRPEDIAGVALFLLSDLSAFVTGQFIEVDGGKPCGFHNFAMAVTETKTKTKTPSQ